MEFRLAGNKDINKLIGIRLEFLNEDYNGMAEEQVNSIRKQLDGYYEDHINKDFYAYIAEEEGQVVASAFLLVVERPANPSFPTGRIGTILNVYTRPGYRRRGLAGRLLEMVKKDAKELRLSYLELLATEEGYPLYLKQGFRDYKSKCMEMRLELI